MKQYKVVILSFLSAVVLSCGLVSAYDGPIFKKAVPKKEVKSIPEKETKICNPERQSGNYAAFPCKDMECYPYGYDMMKKFPHELAVDIGTSCTTEYQGISNEKKGINRLEASADGEKATWKLAKQFCESRDKRLPDVKEAKRMIKGFQEHEVHYPTPTHAVFWTSETNGDSATVCDFDSVECRQVSAGDLHNIWCIRGYEYVDKFDGLKGVKFLPSLEEYKRKTP